MGRPLRWIAVPVAATFALAACAGPGARPDASGGSATSASGPATPSGGPPGVSVPPMPPITTGPPGPTARPTPPPTTAPPAGPRSLVTGVVDAEPGCAGPVTDPPCPARPVAGATVAVTGPNDTVATTLTDSSGRFSFRLAPGTYRFTASNTGGLRSKVTRLVHVPTTAPLELTVDSGLR